VGISRDYLLKTWINKQPTEEIPEYELIPSYPLKYPRSKQGLTVRDLRRRHSTPLKRKTMVTKLSSNVCIGHRT
jgi:hypothetical protein